MLSPRELDHFDTFGFVLRRGLLDRGEVDALRRELDGELDRIYGAFDGRARQWALMSTTRSPTFAALLEDPRFFGLADQALSGHTIGVACDASRFVGDTLWHADTTGPSQWGVKLIFYFEPLRAENGALRVIPGSHREPFHDRVKQFLRAAGSDADVPAFVFDAEPGDVLAYDLRLLHASFGGRAGRPGASVFYYHDPETPEQESAVRDQDRLSRAHIRDFHRRAGSHDALGDHSPLLDLAWITDPSASAARRRWCERLRALGFLDPPALPLDTRDRLPHREGYGKSAPKR